MCLYSMSLFPQDTNLVGMKYLVWSVWLTSVGEMTDVSHLARAWEILGVGSEDCSLLPLKPATPSQVSLCQALG